MWIPGMRVVVGCGCVAAVEWQAPRSESLYVVKVERAVCGAVRHIDGRQILASASGFQLPDDVNAGEI